MSKIALKHYKHRLLSKVWLAWHGIIETKWRQRVEKACQVCALRMYVCMYVCTYVNGRLISCVWTVLNVSVCILSGASQYIRMYVRT